MTTNRLLQLIKSDLPAEPPREKEIPAPASPGKPVHQKRIPLPDVSDTRIPDGCIHKSGILKYCIPELCIHNNGILSCQASLGKRWYKRSEYIDDLLLPTLSPTDQAVYNQLYSGSWRKNRNWYRISLGKLASKCNTSLESVRKSINRLIEKEYISLVESNKVNGNLYRVFLPEEIEILKPSIPDLSIQDLSIQNNGIPEEEGIPESSIQENSIPVANNLSDKEISHSIPESCIQESGNMIKTNTEQNNLSLQTVLQQFYNDLGQLKVSKTKQQKGERDIKELLQDFSLQDVAYAAEWTAKHKKDVRDFALVKHTIGEALAVRDKEEKHRRQRVAREQAVERSIAETQKANEERKRRMEESPYRDVWEKVKEYLRERMTSQSFSSWIMPVYISAVEDDKVVIDCPSVFLVDWLEENYRGLLEEAVGEVEGREMGVDIVCREGNEASPGRRGEAVRPGKD